MIKLPDGTLLDCGDWVLNDDNAFQIALLADRGTVKVEPWTPPAHKTTNTEKVESILVIRSGAIGDLLLLTPAIAALQLRYPRAKITLGCFEKHFAIMARTPVHALSEYPISLHEIENHDMVFSMENVSEFSNSMNVADAYAAALGVTVTDYRPTYRVLEQDRANLLPRGLRPRVALHLKSSSATRDYPMGRWLYFIQLLVAEGWEVVLLGSKGQFADIKGAPPEVMNFCGLPFHQAAAMLENCDVLCAVDSAFYNLAPALGVPVIGLFGATNWRRNTRNDLGQLALTSGAECSPCGWFNRQNMKQWPAGGPCNTSGFCSAIAAIEPARIASKLNAFRHANKNPR